MLGFHQSDIDMLGIRPVYQGFFKLDEYRFKHRLFDGGWSREVRREIYQRSDAIAVLPVDFKHNRLILIEQLRIGAVNRVNSPWLLECIAGMIEPGEDIEQVCHREAMEEAGIKLHKLHKALSYFSSPGGTTEKLHVYVAEVDSSTASGIHGLDDENEDILVHSVDINDAFELLEQGKIDNASTVIALQWLAINKGKLIEQWSE
ncbi:ADP-ribose diphosphatase [Neptunicella marina]|uniref:ADP-ribose pyrophosphatase n=1 Tax=Neptunicella marina TaxID=2125989 RepID=A0A8J6ISA4_9ALTE|nr:ADP-ribose diphosphatase [Neptunicella marina]MBC3764865.1 ADP-ribose diphosphatase [Neptunicella marina]